MYCFIVNPNACSGKGRKIWKRLAGILRQEQVAYKVFFTKGPGHATRIADMLCTKYAPQAADAGMSGKVSGAKQAVQAADTLCTIVAVGGDGTANEVISGLHDYSAIGFGYIPTGSGNDLARGLSLPADPEAALAAILHPCAIRRIHSGCVRINGKDRHFAVSTGIGFDAAVCHETFRSKIKPVLNRIGLGKLTYLGIALKQLLLLRPFSLTLVLDDKEPVTFPAVYFTAVMNLKYEGGGFMFCPDATAEDDFLDICLIEKMPKLKILLLLPTAFKGRHVRYKGVHILRCRRASLHAGCPQPVHTDGEAAAVYSSMDVSLSKEKLPFIVG
ncbi:diacylglycerol/lipid kinase family protein [Marvinbryantia formatexigens]|nr:diacylglycerol kinase family protein [Marvinbryantia formatexigens]UWO24976.1 diacylglycerol kinase family lipid kinase [Marvinbryantia formatexigens DSM 14469]SDG26010.1 lipid kinase, YegS/Rv2252/BmrU family [Marvinbryantia formatexigens]